MVSEGDRGNSKKFKVQNLRFKNQKSLISNRQFFMSKKKAKILRSLVRESRRNFWQLGGMQTFHRWRKGRPIQKFRNF